MHSNILARALKSRKPLGVSYGLSEDKIRITPGVVPSKESQAIIRPVRVLAGDRRGHVVVVLQNSVIQTNRRSVHRNSFRYGLDKKDHRESGKRAFSPLIERLHIYLPPFPAAMSDIIRRVLEKATFYKVALWSPFVNSYRLPCKEPPFRRHLEIHPLNTRPKQRTKSTILFITSAAICMFDFLKANGWYFKKASSSARWLVAN